MKKHKAQKGEVREMLALAEESASKKKFDEALALFTACIQDYLKMNMPFRAIAVAKRVRTVFGPTPKVRSLIIRLYTMMGLYGDARQEYLLAASSLKKDEVRLFQPLDEEVFIELMSVMEIIPAGKGRIVLKQHDEGDDVFVVLSGSLEVLRDSQRLGIMGQGDVFGELGYFCQAIRSATVKTLEKSTLIRIPSAHLTELQQRHPCLRQILDVFYSERIMKKVKEDLGNLSAAPVKQEILATLRYPKGQVIPMGTHDAIAVIKHGVVEIDYDDRRLKRKVYLKAGSMLPKEHGFARANTNVVILLTRMNPGLDPDSKR